MIPESEQMRTSSGMYGNGKHRPRTEYVKDVNRMRTESTASGIRQDRRRKVWKAFAKIDKYLSVERCKGMGIL